MNAKKLTALSLTTAMVASGLGLVNVSAAEPKEATIGVAFYQDAGKAVTATKAYLESLSEVLNVEFAYATFTQTDEAANLTKVQELIAAGVDGIIGTMDLGTPAILSECEAAGIYYAGYLCDFDTSFTSAYEQVFENEMFLGTVSDGPCSDNLQFGTWTLESLVEYNEAHPDNPVTHVSLAMFPTWAFPSQALIAEQFIAEVEAYNETAETQITVDSLNEETDVLEFTAMDSTYFAKHPDSQAIVGIAAGTSFVYPTMVSSGVDSEMKLFTSGFEGGEDENFGSAGTQTYQQCVVAAAESVTYPLVLLLNKINETEFADLPETAERIDSASLVVNSDADMEIFKEGLYYTGEAGNAVWTPEEVLNMTAFGNKEATYAGLVEAIQGLTIDNM